MKDKDHDNLEASSEQKIYAGILQIGMYIGLIVLFITFIIYVSGILDSYISLDKLPEFWKLKVDDYLKNTNIHTGWAWLGMLKYGDFLNFIGIAILAGVTILCYLSIIPSLLKNKDFIYALLAFLEAVILTLAASGVLTSGH